MDEKIIKEYARKYALLHKGLEENRVKIGRELSKELKTMAVLERELEQIKIFVVREPGSVDMFTFNFKELEV